MVTVWAAKLHFRISVYSQRFVQSNMRTLNSGSIEYAHASGSGSRGSVERLGSLRHPPPDTLGPWRARLANHSLACVPSQRIPTNSIIHAGVNRQSLPSASLIGLSPVTEDLFAKGSSLRGRTKVANKVGPPRARVIGQICSRRLLFIRLRFIRFTVAFRTQLNCMLLGHRTPARAKRCQVPL